MYEDLKAFKKLLDEGAITEEDYAKQKIRILGLVDDDNPHLPHSSVIGRFCDYRSF